MDRWIDIEHPYEVIHLRLHKRMRRPIPAPLPTNCWDALNKAEARIYRSNPGMNGVTDVRPNEGDEMLNEIWDNARLYVENEMDLESVRAESREIIIVNRTATRVAQAYAIMAFGAEILING